MGEEDFKDRKAELLRLLPFYVALLHGRTPENTARVMKCKPVDIIAHVEAYLYNLINFHDLVRGKPPIPINRFLERREQFLKGAGLDEYAEATHVKVDKVDGINLAKFVSMN
jgi:hypothetical protein